MSTNIYDRFTQQQPRQQQHPYNQTQAQQNQQNQLQNQTQQVNQNLTQLNIIECTGKQRDNNNRIIRYELRNKTTGSAFTATADEIKAKLTSHSVIITNLKIDQSGRLVDKSPAEIDETLRSLSKPKQIDMTNKELKEFMESLDKSNLDRDRQIAAILKRLLSQNEQLTIKTDQLALKTEELRSKLDEINSRDDLDTKLNDLSNFLIANLDNIDAIKTGIDNILNSLQPVTSNQDNQDSQDSQTNILDGTFEFPGTPYGDYVYNQYFNKEVAEIKDLTTDENIDRLLSKYGLNNEGLNVRELEKLKTEMGNVEKAYKYTEEFYKEQLSEYADTVQMSNVFTNFIDIINDKVPGLKEASDFNEMLPDLKVDIMSTVGKTIFPSLENKAKNMKFKRDFRSEKDTLDTKQAFKLMDGMPGLWNCAFGFISDNEYWETMLYVIQTLNKLYLDTYAISKDYDAMSENGDMKIVHNSSIIPYKGTQKLTEDSLSKIFGLYLASTNLKDTYHECRKIVHDKTVISYFAAKRQLNKMGMFPFSNRSTPEINGIQLKLTIIGMILNNIQKNIIDEVVYYMKESNNHKKDYKYHIKDTKKISEYIN